MAQIFMPHQRQVRLGIDIGSSAVKLALMKTPPHHAPTLLGFVIQPLPDEAVEAKKIRNPAQVNTAIKTACQKLRRHPRNAYLAIPSALAMTRRITLPAAGLTDTAIEARVNLAAESQINSAAEPLSVDYAIRENDQVDLTATRQSNVNERAQLLKGTSVVAAGIDLEAHAVIRAIAPGLNNPNPIVIGIIDCGRDTLTITLMRQGRLLHARDQIIRDASTSAALRAEAVKRGIALLTGSGITDQPTQLVLCGGHSHQSGLMTHIEQRTGLPVALPELAPLVASSPPLIRRAFAGLASQLITAIGLASPGSNNAY